MDSRFAQSVRILIALLALAAPVVAALYLAGRQSFDEQASLAQLYAADVKRRTDDTADQIATAFEALGALAPEERCSDAGLALMASLHVPSDRLQTVGQVVDGRLVCSSVGRHGEGIALPPPTYTSDAGNHIRVAVGLPWSQDRDFLVVTQQATGLTAVVHPLIPVDVAPGTDGLAVGVYGLSSHRLMVSQGRFSEHWVTGLGEHAGQARVVDGYVVVVLPSDQRDYAAYAAVPYHRVTETLASRAGVLVPIALAAGGVLAYLGVQAARRQQAVPAQLRTGIRRGEFFLQYQPIVSLADGRIVGAEALVRWRRSTGELIRPDIFIPAAEESGMITRLTAHILRLAGRDLGDLFRHHPEFHLALNLSSADMHDPGVLERLQQLIEESGAAPGNLMVEATERGFVDAGRSRAVMQGIRGLGIEIAIDDFGTGYSSLSQLQHLELDYLKIDKCFVDTIGKDAATSQVIPHIIDMAKGLGLRMIAEGVETAEQADYLRRRGVGFAQGWHFGKPMALAELRQRLGGTSDGSAPA